MKVGKLGNDLYIKRDKLTEYSKRPIPRVRLFQGDESLQEMMGDGFIREYNGNFYVYRD